MNEWMNDNPISMYVYSTFWKIGKHLTSHKHKNIYNICQVWGLSFTFTHLPKLSLSSNHEYNDLWNTISTGCCSSCVDSCGGGWKCVNLMPVGVGVSGHSAGVAGVYRGLGCVSPALSSQQLWKQHPLPPPPHTHFYTNVPRICPSLFNDTSLQVSRATPF